MMNNINIKHVNVLSGKISYEKETRKWVYNVHSFQDLSLHLDERRFIRSDFVSLIIQIKWFLQEVFYINQLI